MTNTTDAEISRDLALAIGWGKSEVYVYTYPESGCEVWCGWDWVEFDYRDPAVIWPIAERFDAFPWKSEESWEAAIGYMRCYADTAAKAVALVVIKAKGGRDDSTRV